MASVEHVSSLYLKNDSVKDYENQSNSREEKLECLVCRQSIESEDNDQTIAICLQKHLLTNHKLMIADIDTIVDLKRYTDHYRQKIAASRDWTKLCAAIATNRSVEEILNLKYQLLN